MRVIELPRPHVINNISTNHGGIVIDFSSSVRLQSVNIAWQSYVVLVRRLNTSVVGSNQSSCFVLYSYRPLAVHLMQCILRRAVGGLFQHLTALDVPVIVAGDVNIHLERTDESNSGRFPELLACSDEY